MKKNRVFLLGIAALLTLWSASGVQAFQVITQEMFEKETVTTKDLIRNVDNFIVLFDTSGSSNEMVPGRNISRIQATKNLLKERNAWLPDLGYHHLNQVVSIQLDATAPDNVYLLADGVGLLIGHDGGRRWQVLGKPGELERLRFTTMLLSFEPQLLLMVGVKDEGAWRYVVK